MMKVRKISVSDISEISKIHMQAFPNFFLTSLGISFLKTFYKTCIKNKSTIALCVEKNNKILGFCIGTKKSKYYYKKIIVSNIGLYFLEFLVILFSKPKKLVNIILNIEKKSYDDNGLYSEIISICVNSDFVGLKIGSKLISSFEKEVKINGSNMITLTTDLLDNDNVIRFYKKNGYEKMYEFRAYPQRKMLKLIKEL